MPRYVAKADSWYMDEHRPMSLGGITVHEPVREVEDTGLLDSQGNRLYRLPDVIQFGFVKGPDMAKRKGKGGRKC